MKVKKRVVQDVEFEIPDYYSYDESLRGKLANIFIRTYDRGTTTSRDLLYNPEEAENAAADICNAYVEAERIMNILRLENIIPS